MIVDAKSREELEMEVLAARAEKLRLECEERRVMLASRPHADLCKPIRDAGFYWVKHRVRGWIVAEYEVWKDESGEAVDCSWAIAGDNRMWHEYHFTEVGSCIEP